VHEDPNRQQVFKIGKVLPSLNNEYHFINDFSQSKAFMGITTSYLKSSSRMGRLGVIYFICGSWTPPVPGENNVLPEEEVIEIIVEEESIVEDATEEDTSLIDNTETSDSSKNIEEIIDPDVNNDESQIDDEVPDE